jgi:hypothetical protein
VHSPGQIQAILLALIGLMIVCGVLPVAVFGGWMWRFGSRVKAGGRFPPADALRWKNSTVLEGDAARARGTLFQALAALLGGASIGMLWALWRLWVTLS